MLRNCNHDRKDISDIGMCDELKYTSNHLQKVKDTFSATENLEFVCPENTWLHHYQIFSWC